MVGPLTARHRHLITVLEVARVETFLRHRHGCPGRPPAGRSALARAFMAKAVFGLASTELLVERLAVDKCLRRLCGWERAGDVPSVPTFSRAFLEFATIALPSRLHAAVIEVSQGARLIGHISRDSTAIRAREKPRKVVKEEKPKRQRKGEEQAREAGMGAPSVPPGRYFRMHLVGCFEGIDSERGLEWRCSDSLSLREFLRLESRDRVPDHCWLSKTRTRLPHEGHAAVFDRVLARTAEAGLVKGDRIGVDASTMDANAALRNIVRRDTGEGYREMLRVCRSDPEARVARMKDGTTHLADKPGHAVDLDTGAVVAAELHPADEGDTTTLFKTLAAAEANLEAVAAAPTPESPPNASPTRAITHGRS